MQEPGTNNALKAKSRTVMCGNFSTENEALCGSTSTQNVDIGLLRMMLSMADGKSETLTNALLNARIAQDKTILVAVPPGKL
eukprot:49336-Prorocentrum_lima.AAC.1